MDKTILKVENASKKFSKSLKHVMLHGAADITRDFFGVKTNSTKLRDGEFWAVDDVSFVLKQGESIGLIGRNGSGKSTLLKVINGIYTPDKGRVRIDGRVGALIEVGAGFHPMLTGRENIYVNGSILGLSKREIDQKFDAILDFSGIADFIDTPVKHYSSGMYVRLGFAIAINCVPDLLLIDEVLAVGDYQFQIKCMDKIKELQRNGVSIVFVSHSDSHIKSVCKHGICLDQSKPIFYGNVDDALLAYHQVSNAHQKDALQHYGHDQSHVRRGTGQARFSTVTVTDMNGTAIDHVSFGTNRIKIIGRYTCKEKIENPRFFAALRDASRSEMVIVLSATTSVDPISFIEGEGEIEFQIDVNDLGPNLYGIYTGITDSVMYDICYDIWDINGVFLEITPSDQLPRNELVVSRPYIIPSYTFKHTRI
ncbi:MAG: ABC transporter ATP-binding protein [Peptococcaceae bacterium]|nr:ABC transporter ATP-binding protein [Peptococcaceae bacterium]